MNRNTHRPTAVITGASGGMGRACARAFGADMDLIITDITGLALRKFASDLKSAGYRVTACVVGALESTTVLSELCSAMREASSIGVLIHTAGQSPTQADWKSIMRSNLVATEMLLHATQDLLQNDSVTLLIASMAGHMVTSNADIDTLLDSPLQTDLFGLLEPLMHALAHGADERVLSGLSYGLSKRAVIRLCEQRAAAWGQRGARILSISPGTIWTPMGLKEAAENPAAAAVVQATPAGRWGTAMDIAAVARFLASPQASFVSGCDLRIDGGVTAALRYHSNPATA